MGHTGGLWPEERQLAESRPLPPLPHEAASRMGHPGFCGRREKRLAESRSFPPLPQTTRQGWGTRGTRRLAPPDVGKASAQGAGVDRGQLAEAADCGWNYGQGLVDVLLGVELGQAEAEAGAGAFGGESHGGEDVGRLGCS